VEFGVRRAEWGEVPTKPVLPDGLYGGEFQVSGSRFKVRRVRRGHAKAWTPNGEGRGALRRG